MISHSRKITNNNFSGLYYDPQQDRYFAYDPTLTQTREEKEKEKEKEKVKEQEKREKMVNSFSKKRRMPFTTDISQELFYFDNDTSIRTNTVDKLYSDLGCVSKKQLTYFPKNPLKVPICMCGSNKLAVCTDKIFIYEITENHCNKRSNDLGFEPTNNGNNPKDESNLNCPSLSKNSLMHYQELSQITWSFGTNDQLYYTTLGSNTGSKLCCFSLNSNRNNELLNLPKKTIWSVANPFCNNRPKENRTPKKLILGCSGSILTFDLQKSKIIRNMPLKKSDVFCLQSTPNILISGTRDGSLFVSDLRMKKTKIQKIYLQRTPNNNKKKKILKKNNNYNNKYNNKYKYKSNYNNNTNLFDSSICDISLSKDEFSLFCLLRNKLVLCDLRFPKITQNFKNFLNFDYKMTQLKQEPILQNGIIVGGYSPLSLYNKSNQFPIVQFETNETISFEITEYNNSPLIITLSEDGEISFLY
ncbi:hypothetical protein M0813_27174 [Anaeramoeba flamelloides]|uniref:Uncharacterized protein n=1 Tax=Anaeramoeba flamelloides TaxID=1746091 RepID=A0ABQ8XYD3_9EUKA|nr:hypothetical protein M0813_27174 [Anaeramoeba flamelloides]